MTEFHHVGRWLILWGALLVIAGAMLLVLPKLPWLGRLPGDILIQRERTTFYVPLATSLLLSLLLSLGLWLFRR
ncbi:MAG: DUF2905 domain-containing protein [Candidatus Omnitrophica bacterium]|nr:DUF2905 domain-containing protein [Candidatus Omnitrophota bacterium]